MKTIDNGLIIEAGTNVCCGYIFDFTGHGAFAPDGLVEINGVKRQPTKEEVETHNSLLAQGEIMGLDQNCEIGMRGTFYYSPLKGVTTWTGVKVADYTLSPRQTVLTFTRAGKTYRGRLQKNADCFNFKRIA